MKEFKVIEFGIGFYVVTDEESNPIFSIMIHESSDEYTFTTLSQAFKSVLDKYKIAKETDERKDADSTL